MSLSGRTGPKPPSTSLRDRLIVAAAVVFGCVMRGVLLGWPTGAFDSDEAIVGLMARHLVERGDFTTFFYGQSYGGSLEAILTSVPVALLPGRPAAVKVVPIVLNALAAVLVWRVGRRTVGGVGARFAAAAYWIWPANYVWFSTKARGFYWVALVLGLTIILLTLRLAGRPTSWPDWCVLGLAAGLGWWTTPQVLYFVVPCGLWLLWRLRTDAWRALAALPLAVLGAAPWLMYNIRTDWASLEVTSVAFDKGFFGNIWVLLSNGIPVALGLHAAERWLVPVVFPLVYALAIGLIVFGAYRKRGAVSLLGAVAAAYPLIWGWLPVSGVVGEGRYVLFLAPALSLLLVHALGGWWRQVAFVGVAAALSVAGALTIRDHSSAFLIDATSGAATTIEMPRDTGLLVAALEREEIDRAYADYWIAYRVTFETDEEVVIAPLNVSRYPAYDRAVAADDAPAFVYVRGAPAAGALRERLRSTGVAFDETVAGDFVVIEPAEKVSPR